MVNKYDGIFLHEIEWPCDVFYRVKPSNYDNINMISNVNLSRPIIKI